MIQNLKVMAGNSKNQVLAGSATRGRAVRDRGRPWQPDGSEITVGDRCSVSQRPSARATGTVGQVKKD